MICKHCIDQPTMQDVTDNGVLVGHRCESCGASVRYSFWHEVSAAPTPPLRIYDRQRMETA